MLVHIIISGFYKVSKKSKTKDISENPFSLQVFQSNRVLFLRALLKASSLLYLSIKVSPRCGIAPNNPER